jgi:NTP-dependent ternary conflict system VMAP-like protein/caspase domain-containing protein
MNDVYAFVVGIDRYDEPKWTIPGPCVNALAVTEWLLAMLVPPENIFLFLDPGEGLDGRIDQIAGKKVVVNRSASWGVIDTFWRTELRKKRNADSRLLVYWSGHGFARTDKSRIFICRDYTAAALRNRIFNGSMFLDHLRSPEYQFFGEQIFLADACATYTNLKFTDTTEAPDKVVDVASQVAYFATPIGKYAAGENGTGVFTNVVLGVLKKFKSWPGRAAFSQKMRDAFATESQVPYRVGGFDAQGDILDSIVGYDSGRHLFDSLCALLKAFELSDDVYRLHYLRTASDLGIPELAKEQDLPAMLRALTKFTVDSSAEVPFGLLQFLMRVSEETGLAEPIKGWIEEHAAGHGNVLANVRRKLDVERAVKILLVEVSNDDQGGIQSYEVYVRGHDLVPVPDIAYPQRPVKDWEDFCAKMLTDIRDLEERHSITDFEIHFIVDSPLFDLPFHSIRRASGTALGDDHIVVLRQRMRARHRNQVRDGKWRRYAEALRPRPPSELKLVPVPSVGNLLPGEKGICYFSTVLPPAPAGGPANTAKKQTLQRILNNGVPYLLWMHCLPGADGWQEMEGSFTSWLRQLASLDRFPAAVTDRRGENPLASQVTLLWDDPQFNPFQWRVRR